MRKLTRLQCLLVTCMLFIVTLLLSVRSINRVGRDSRRLQCSGAGGKGTDQGHLTSVCSVESCRSDYVRHLASRDSYPIPPIRHILWKNESVSKYFMQHLHSWHRIHPNWTFVLWRDADLEPFVAAHFPGLLAKFKSLPKQIMRVDMIRYMLLFKFGGVYADLDYSLVRSLDEYRRFYAVVTREPDVHSLQVFGLSWPLKVFANPAFLMSAPGHIFHHFVLTQLESRSKDIDTLSFAGPYGLTEMIARYQAMFPTANNAMETVLVPPSYSFYPYPGNRLNNTRSSYLSQRMSMLEDVCSTLQEHREADQCFNLVRYCSDINNLDPITDASQPVFAVHDMFKTGASYGKIGQEFYTQEMQNALKAVRGLQLGSDFMSNWERLV